MNTVERLSLAARLLTSREPDSNEQIKWTYDKEITRGQIVYLKPGITLTCNRPVIKYDNATPAYCSARIKTRHRER